MSRVLSLFACAGLCLAAARVGGAEWPQWRGLHRDGKSPETGLLKAWPSGGPPLVWKTQGLGAGYSSFAVAEGRLFTQGQRDAKQYVMAFDVANGKKLWEVQSGGAYEERRGPGPRGTPTIEGDRLYSLSANGNLLCLETASGKTVWSMDLVRDLGGRIPHWGISESPLIDGENVIVTPGGRGAAIAALNKSDGKLVWKSQSDEAGYSSPVAVETGGVRAIVVLTGNGVVAVSPRDGELLWRYDKVSNRTANIATPIVRGDHVFVSTDYGTGCALLKLTSSGRGMKASEVYFNREMRNHYSTSVLVGEYLYGFSSSVLTAMRFSDGEVAWRDRSVGKGSVIFADGHLYALGENGSLALVEATPEEYREKSRFEIARGAYPTWAPPVISGGKLYLREQDNLYCYDVQAR
ncbi:MAG: PQQ-like beta-propeller repeat protein [Bryobacteraceae bacterium]|nr:PQQ-like beta-propeller repeat protein [Bryobacteraceae bacterium]